MNPKPIFKLFSLKGIGPTVILRQTSILVIIVAMLALVALTAYAQDPANDTEVEAAGPVVAPVAGAEQAPAGDSAFLAANPELAVARRYAPARTQTTGSIILAANPELSVARRYATMME